MHHMPDVNVALDFLFSEDAFVSRILTVSFCSLRHKQLSAGSLHSRWQWDPEPGPWDAALALRADLPGRCERAHRCHGSAHQVQPHLLDQLAHAPNLILRAPWTVLVLSFHQLSPKPAAERGPSYQPAGNRMRARSSVTDHASSVWPNFFRLPDWGAEDAPGHRRGLGCRQLVLDRLWARCHWSGSAFRPVLQDPHLWHDRWASRYCPGPTEAVRRSWTDSCWRSFVSCSQMLLSFRTMYWADWGNHPKIETAAMDGTLRQTLIFENIQWPTGWRHQIICPDFPAPPCWTPSSSSAGLAVDHFNERLYWSDAKLSVIGSVRLDGSDPVIAVSGIKNSWVLSASKVSELWRFKVAHLFCVGSRPAPPLQHRHLWGLHIRGHIYEQLCLPGQQVWQRPNGESHYRHQPRHRYSPASPLQAAREWVLRVLTLWEEQLASQELTVLKMCPFPLF